MINYSKNGNKIEVRDNSNTIIKTLEFNDQKQIVKETNNMYTLEFDYINNKIHVTNYDQNLLDSPFYTYDQTRVIMFDKSGYNAVTATINDTIFIDFHILPQLSITNQDDKYVWTYCKGLVDCSVKSTKKNYFEKF